MKWLTFAMDLRQQVLIPFDHITLAGGHRWKIQLNKVADGMASVTKSPIQCVKTAAQVNDLTFVTSFLQKKIVQ